MHLLVVQLAISVMHCVQQPSHPLNPSFLILSWNTQLPGLFILFPDLLPQMLNLFSLVTPLIRHHACFFQRRIHRNDRSSPISRFIHHRIRVHPRPGVDLNRLVAEVDTRRLDSLDLIKGSLLRLCCLLVNICVEGGQLLAHLVRVG